MTDDVSSVKESRSPWGGRSGVTACSRVLDAGFIRRLTTKSRLQQPIKRQRHQTPRLTNHISAQWRRQTSWRHGDVILDEVTVSLYLRHTETHRRLYVTSIANESRHAVTSPDAMTSSWCHTYITQSYGDVTPRNDAGRGVSQSKTEALRPRRGCCSSADAASTWHSCADASLTRPAARILFETDKTKFSSIIVKHDGIGLELVRTSEVYRDCRGVDEAVFVNSCLCGCCHRLVVSDGRRLQLTRTSSERVLKSKRPAALHGGRHEDLDSVIFRRRSPRSAD